MEIKTVKKIIKTQKLDPQKSKTQTNFCETKKMRKIVNPAVESNGSTAITSFLPGQTNRQKVGFMRGQKQDSLATNQLTSPLPSPTLGRETHQQIKNMTITNNSGPKTPQEQGQNTPAKLRDETWKKECRFWNQKKCERIDCKYQHFSLKNFLTEQNLKYSEMNDKAQIQDEKLKLIEIKFKCLVDQSSLIQIIEEPLTDHIIMRKIALAINNKRRTQKLKTQIKQKISLSNDANQQQVCIINQFCNNIDSVKNHNKIKSTPTKSAQKEALPEVKGQQIINQNNQIINSLSHSLHPVIHYTLPMQSNKVSQYIESTLLSIQSQLLKSIEPISPNKTLELNPEGKQIPTGTEDELILKLPITLPELNPLLTYSQSLKQENIFYASDIHPNETYLLKLVQRVSCQEKDNLTLNIYISHRIAQDIYLRILKTLLIILSQSILFYKISLRSQHKLKKRYLFGVNNQKKQMKTTSVTSTQLFQYHQNQNTTHNTRSEKN